MKITLTNEDGTTVEFTPVVTDTSTPDTEPVPDTDTVV